MERNKKTPLLLLLLPLLLIGASTAKNCPSLPMKNLTCYNDFNRVISCEWNSAFVSEHPDTVCTLHAENTDNPNLKYRSSCVLEPADASGSVLSRCSMVFNRIKRFYSFTELNISVNCNPVKQSFYISYSPACHIKLNPPTMPGINLTTFSWFSNNTDSRVQSFCYQLQWKQAKQLWNDPLETIPKNANSASCKAQILHPDRLTRGERYEARVRVMIEDNHFLSTWSDWSPTASWVSEIGKPKPPDVPDVTQIALGSSACVVAIIVMIILMRTDKTTWVYMVKRMKGQPIPNPGSFLHDENFQESLYHYFTSESFYSVLKPVDIASVEVTSAVDAVVPRCPEAALQEKMRSESGHESTGSGFSNPSYSQMSPHLPISSLIAGNLEPCEADAPYGPVLQGQGEHKEAERAGGEVRDKELEIQQLLSKGNTERMMVISDYEKVEKPLVERLRLQSLDSGMCSGEEVSQESLEADSLNGTDCQDDHREGEEDRQDGSGQEVYFKKLFGGTVFKGSIQVCSGYEQVQKPQPELSNVDSGTGSSDEEQASQEEDNDKIIESTSLLCFPPPPVPPVPALACSSPSHTPLCLSFPGAALSPTLPSDMLERIALMSAGRMVEPSGDGYMPVRKEQS